MNLQQNFIEHLQAFSFFKKNEKQIVAVSGGVDSVVLCYLLHTAGYDFIIAHCNFHLRGEESNMDELFVRQLGDKLQKSVVVTHFNTDNYAQQHGMSIQVAARNLRYNWFQSLRKDIIQQNQIVENTNAQKETALVSKQSDCYICTAHHADDNIETVLMNFFRGTGLQGLCGIEDVQNKVFRPLLTYRKTQLLQYAKEQSLLFVEDSSNSDSKYTRNYFRNDILPSIEKVFPKVDENLLSNIDRFKDINAWFIDVLIKTKQKLITYKEHEEHIPILLLKKHIAYKTVLWYIIKEKSFSAGQINEVVKLMHAGNNGFIDSSTHRIIKNRRWLIITPLQHQVDDSIKVINESDQKVLFGKGELEFSISSHNNEANVQFGNHTALVDAALLKFPLLLRKWKKGDYFYPLGMQKKKKVSRFLIDQKLGLHEKENVWVLESEKKIIWVIHLRIDDRFKLTKNTKQVCKIVFKN